MHRAPADGTANCRDRRGRHQDVPRRPDPDRGRAARRRQRDRPRAARQRRPRARHDRARATRSRSAGTKPPRCCSATPTRPRTRTAGDSMSDRTPDELNILAPTSSKPKLDYLHREVQRARRAPHQPPRGARRRPGWRCWRAAAAATTTGGGSSGSSAPAAQLHDRRARRQAAGGPAGDLQLVAVRRPVDATRTSRSSPAEKAAGLKLNETYYSSNDELLAKLQRRRHRLRHHRAQPERGRPADRGGQADGARRRAPAQPEEPRPGVPQAVVRPHGQVPRDQGLRRSRCSSTTTRSSPTT